MGNEKMGNRKTGSKKTESKNTGSKKAGATKPRSHHKATERSAKQILPFHRRRCIIIKDPKHRGEWTELVFMTRVAERGFNVSKPWGDSSRYDCAVERHGHFLRVQVKSTIARFYGGYICSFKSSRCQFYTRHQVDFFAVYVIPEDVWYIFPSSLVTVCRGHFMLNPRRHPQKYEAYKEAWHLLKAGCHRGRAALQGRASSPDLRRPSGPEAPAPAAKACPERVEGRRKIAPHSLP